MSIVETKTNDTTRVEFVVETSREGVRRRISRFFSALGQNNSMGHNGFMLQDRAVREEFRVSADRQAMNK